METLATRIGHHSLVYLTTSVVTVLGGLVSLAVQTRYLKPAEFGTLAVLYVFSTILTLVFNAGSLQGTFSWAFGSTGDDDTELDDGGELANDPRRALATGLLLTASVGLAGTLLAAAFADPLAALLLRDGDDASLVIWAATAGAAAAIWRLSANSLRLERRPIAYLSVTILLNLTTLGFTWILLAKGQGLRGAILGIATGTIVSTVFALILAKRNIRFAASWSDAAEIMRRGRALIPVVFSFNVIQLGDLLFVGLHGFPWFGSLIHEKGSSISIPPQQRPQRRSFPGTMRSIYATRGMTE